MKKVFALLLVVFSCFVLVSGCGNKEEDVKSDSPAETLVQDFREIVKKDKDIESIATKLSQNEIIDFAMDVADVTKEEWYPGFTELPVGVKKAYKVAPIIGSMPFIMYVFESNDAESLKSDLEAKADPRWNICTEAEETIIQVDGNIVFFVMAPSSFEE